VQLDPARGPLAVERSIQLRRTSAAVITDEICARRIDGDLIGPVET
jgi:hypothetical protein